MLGTGFICFLLVLILLHARNSSAFTPQAKEKRIVTKGDEFAMNVIKEISAAMDEESSNRRLTKGRKMMMKWVLRKEMKEEELDIEKRNCKHRNEKCKMRINSHPLKEKLVGFTAFSADYHVPKSHPPKHNR